MADLERQWLDGTSWLDVGRGWLERPDEVYAALAAWDGWRQGAVFRYDHVRRENRLSGVVRPGPTAPHPAITVVHKALRRQYGVDFGSGGERGGLQPGGIGMSWYRDGRDAMGAHRDSDLRWCDSTIIAVLTLGATRPWTLRPRSGTAPAVDVAPRAGDLLVMGGRAQADWLHGVPPVPGLREGRISLQWRWTSRAGRPEVGGGSRAPRRYGHGR